MRTSFHTIANSRYFVGAVALLNSLRLAGHDEELVVLDAGLAPGERALLAAEARVVDIPEGAGRDAYLVKPYPQLVGASGLAVVLDSDLLVTRRLDELLAPVAEGRVGAFPEHPEARGRWFAEWADALPLAAPLRREPYVNAGFVAVPVEAQPGFLPRWWELCGLVPPGQHFGPDMGAPFWAGDMDALNALLMSEVPAQAVARLPEAAVAYWDELDGLDLLDAATLDVRRRGTGEAVSVLHYSFSPKPWERDAWLRVRRDVFTRLLGRVLFGDDVALRPPPGALPLWLRPSASGRASLAVLDGAHGAVRGAVFALPAPVRGRLLRARNAFFRRLRA